MIRSSFSIINLTKHHIYCKTKLTSSGVLDTHKCRNLYEGNLQTPQKSNGTEADVAVSCGDVNKCCGTSVGKTNGMETGVAGIPLERKRNAQIKTNFTVT